MSHGDPDLRMPPKQDRLPDSTIADFKKWIEMGAPDPRDEVSVTTPSKRTLAGRDFWAYQAVKSHPVPAVADGAWPKSSIDYFVLAKLEDQSLTPSTDAPPATLLRRLYFDLVGLPPSPDALSQFLDQVNRDGIDVALAAKVDELLASSQFGERWGRHWLDVARFAESSGTEANLTFPYAWRYRDYVIDSVNKDIPFDRLITEQIAGDLLPTDDPAERARRLIATGFLALGPKNLDSVDARQFHADVIDEQIDTVTRAIIGSSIACARCHDHKFDPYSMQDYYALAGIFASSKTYFGTAVSPSNRIGGEPLRLPETEDQVVLHASLPEKRVQELKSQLATLQAQQAAIDEATRAMFAGMKPKTQVTLQEALRIFWQTGSVKGELAKVSETGEALPLAMGVLDAEQITDVPLLERGDIKKPSQVIARALPQIHRFDDQTALPDKQSGRLELATWLTDPRHPLTSRVMVNRVWRHLFGAGIVASVDNFGTTGDPPSHPELLDKLAVGFVEEGWSLKRLVRSMVLSRVYRQSSAYRVDAFQADPDNRLLWRASKRRLDAECIRDAMLAASGEIDLKRPQGSLVGRVIGDRPISLIGLDARLPKDLDGSVHRSVYLPVIRDRLPDVLDLFDFAEPSLVTGNRETTNVPLQSLYMMNSDYVQDRAKGFAKQINQEASSKEQRVRRAFAICFCREPEPSELKRSVEFLQNGGQLVSFCQALLCTGEFRNLD